MLAQRLEPQVIGRSPLLVFADPLDGERETACNTVLSASSERQSPALLVFAYNRRPRVVAEHVSEHVDGGPAGLTILDLCDGDARATDEGYPGPTVTVEQLAAGNLTDIGIRVADAIDRADDHPLHVCLGSLTTLIQYVPLETAFKFLQVTISRLESAGGVVHGHLDPEALDDEAIETLRPLFDSVLERTDDKWTVHAEA